MDFTMVSFDHEKANIDELLASTFANGPKMMKCIDRIYGEDKDYDSEAAKKNE